MKTLPTHSPNTLKLDPVAPHVARGFAFGVGCDSLKVVEKDDFMLFTDISPANNKSQTTTKVMSKNLYESNKSDLRQNNSKFKIINFIINTPRINAGA